MTTYSHNASRNRDERRAVTGSGRIRERIITAPNTSRFHVSGSFRVMLTVDPARTDDITLRVRADDQVLPFVRAKHHHGALHLTLKDGAYHELGDLRVTATVGRVSEVCTAAMASVTLQGLDAAAIKLVSTGASRIDASGWSHTWITRASGTSRLFLAVTSVAVTERVAVSAHEGGLVTLAGHARTLDVRADGAGKVLAAADAFRADRARVQLSGAAQAEIGARTMVTGRVRFPARLRVACPGEIRVDGPYH